MSNQTEPAAPHMPPEARRRLKLIEDIRRVAQEIGYRGRGDTERLGQALDDRGIQPLRANTPNWKGYWGGKWLGPERTPFRACKLGIFLRRWVQDLLEHGGASAVQSGSVVKVTCLCFQCGLTGTDACNKRKETKAVTLPNVTLDSVTHTPVTHEGHELPTDLGGWTLCHDSRGIFKAVKRITGKLKSIYVGKDPSKAGEKIKAWSERADACHRTEVR